jgi:hypothetical protein
LESFLAAIGKTAEGEYKFFKLLTCFNEVGYWNWHDKENEAGYLESSSKIKLSMPQMISIIFFLLLLIFYLVIEERSIL